MEVLFKNKTRYTQKEYDLFLEEYQKEFAMSENLYTLFNFVFFGFCAGFAFYGHEIWLGIVIILALLFYAWYKFIRPARRVQKTKQSNKVDGKFINKYTFYKNYFKVDNPDGNAQLYYFKLYRVTETKTHFYIYISREYAFIMSKKGFEDDKSEEFSKFIKKKMHGKYRNRAKLESRDNKKDKEDK